MPFSFPTFFWTPGCSLLLDAMQIVVTSQPRLNEIYQTISPASGTVPLIINANGREVIELPRGHAMSMPMPMAVDPEPIKHEHILNGNALGMEINVSDLLEDGICIRSLSIHVRLRNLDVSFFSSLYSPT